MKITYRKATEDDVYGYEYVSAISWKDTYWNLLPKYHLKKRVERLTKPEELEPKLQSLRKHINENPGKVFVALDKNKIVGILEIKENKEQYPGYGNIDSLYVLPEYKGYGIGKSLFFIGIKELMKLGYNKMQLECLKGNKTLDFYKKYNGTVVETVKWKLYNRNKKVDIVKFENIKEILEEK